MGDCKMSCYVMRCDGMCNLPKCDVMQCNAMNCRVMWCTARLRDVLLI